jgi:hypothetical protein
MEENDAKQSHYKHFFRRKRRVTSSNSPGLELSHPQADEDIDYPPAGDLGSETATAPPSEGHTAETTPKPARLASKRCWEVVDVFIGLFAHGCVTA